MIDVVEKDAPFRFWFGNETDVLAEQFAELVGLREVELVQARESAVEVFRRLERGIFEVVLQKERLERFVPLRRRSGKFLVDIRRKNEIVGDVRSLGLVSRRFPLSLELVHERARTFVRAG